MEVCPPSKGMRGWPARLKRRHGFIKLVLFCLNVIEPFVALPFGVAYRKAPMLVTPHKE